MNRPLSIALIVSLAGIWTGACFLLFFVSWFMPEQIMNLLFIPLFPFMVSAFIGTVAELYRLNVGAQYLVIFIITFGVSFIFLYLIYLAGMFLEIMFRKLKFF